MVYRRPLKESSTALHTVCSAGETSVSLRKQESSLVCARFIHTWIQLDSQQMFSGMHIWNTRVPLAARNSQHRTRREQHCNHSFAAPRIKYYTCLPPPDPELSGWSVKYCSAGHGAQPSAAAFVAYHEAHVSMYLRSTYRVEKGLSASKRSFCNVE